MHFMYIVDRCQSVEMQKIIKFRMNTGNNQVNKFVYIIKIIASNIFDVIVAVAVVAIWEKNFAMGKKVAEIFRYREEKLDEKFNLKNEKRIKIIVEDCRWPREFENWDSRRN